jgi:hypothetical protein
MVEQIEKSIQDLDFAALTQWTFTPSPAAWEDQVMYFLLLDRFSDGKEKDGYRDEADRPVHGGSTPLYRPEDSGRVDETQPVTAYSTVAPTFRVEGDQLHLIFWYAPKRGRRASGHIGRGAQERAAGCPDDTSARRFRALPGGPWNAPLRP